MHKTKPKPETTFIFKNCVRVPLCTTQTTVPLILWTVIIAQMMCNGLIFFNSNAVKYSTTSSPVGPIYRICAAWHIDRNQILGSKQNNIKCTDNNSI